MIEASRSLKELFHEARERASKALGFAKMLRKVREPENQDCALLYFINFIIVNLSQTVTLPANQPTDYKQSL